MMSLSSSWPDPRIFSAPIVLILICLSFVGADDAKGNVGEAPKSPSCNNSFELVKVKNWVGGAEGKTLVGMNAKFGALVPSHAEKAIRLPAVFANPSNCCSSSSSKLSGFIVLSIRGECDFMQKAKVAQSGGAAALVVMNDKEGLSEMDCSDSDAALNISIPVIMISKSGGEALNKSMGDGLKVELLLYAPKRPVVDFSVAFLWMMAVVTILCASCWSQITAPQQANERYNELSPKNFSKAETLNDDSENEVLNISAKGAIFFIITASAFLVLLYFFMSSWFVWVLIVLFCIGGVEGMHACIVSLVLRKGRNCGHKTVNLPCFGEVSIFSLVVLLFCVAFAIFWATTRKASYSWFGQDVLGICLIITVLQMARLPNIKVATENLAELCACGGGEKVEDNAKNEKEYEVSGSGSGLNSSSSRGDQDIVSKRDGSVVMNQPIKEADKGRKSPTKSKISQGKRKVKVDWTPELHMRFVQAVEQVGVDKAVPSRILELMGIERLNRHNIASHLQKYRSSHRKHLVAREAEATNWSKTREMNGQATGGVGRRDTSPWQAPTCMGFPPITPMHHFRPLLVWGHPTMDQSLMPMMWPKHRADHPPSPPSPAWAPVSWPPLRDPLHDWHPHQQSAPNVLNRGTPCFPQPILPTPASNLIPYTK